MAGALIGEASLSASIQRICDKIDSVELMDFFRRKELDHSLLVKLKPMFLALDAVVDDAEEEQIEKPRVGKWLDELKHAVFGAKDLLHEIDTEILRRKVEAEISTKKTQVWNFSSTSLNPFYQGMNGRIEELLQRLEHLAQKKDVLGLRGGFGDKVSRRSSPVLSLPGYENVTKLTNSIRNLRSLRYIDLSHTGIRRLPDIICTLYNLETLLLAHCSSLIELPADMHKLINLRHVDISGTNIKDMPLRMGRLTNLRSLSTFVVGKSTGASIRELGELPNIMGKLSILKLHDGVDAKDALQANLKGKQYLKELTLKWRDDARICRDYHNDRDVLDKLQPPINLEKLTIEFYGRNRFPNWLGDSSFSCVQFMRLSHCSCLSLPSLGQLPALKVLFIGGLNFLSTVGPRFYGDGTSLIQPFQRLEKLVFVEMPEWEDWLPSGGQSPVFPRLEELVLKKCPKLRGNLPNHLPSLKKLSVSGCGVLHERATTTFNVELQHSVEELTLDGCPILLSLLGKEFLTSLQKLEIGNFVNIEGLLNKMVRDSNHLQMLSIWNCPSLMEFPSGRLPTALTSLHLQKCQSLSSFPLGLFPQLRNLSIRSCVNLESLSFEKDKGEISHLKSLSVF